jgi:hypothetical protein
MSLHQLGRAEEARSALRKATDWIDDQARKAEADVGSRVRYEFLRSSLESLLQEARDLLSGEPKLG